MKKTLQKALSLVLSLALALSLTTVAFAATVSVTGVSLNQSVATLVLNGDSAGKTVTLTATVTPDNATNQRVNWGSNKTSVATVSSSGVVTAVGEGTATITATTADGGYSATCSVSVVDNYVTDVTITPVGPGTLSVGDTRTLSADVTYKRTGGNDRGVGWKSTDISVATVNSSGKVTAVSAGTATITATAKDEGNNGTTVADTYKLTVTDGRIVMNQNTLALNTGTSQTLAYTMNTSSTATAVWTSDDTSVAKVDAGRVTGVKAGTATITVSVGGAQATCKVTVLDAGKDTLTMSKLQETVYGGLHKNITLTLPAFTIQNGATDVSGSYTLAYQWVGADNKVVGMNASYTGVCEGSTRYTCVVTAISKTDSTKNLTAYYTCTLTALPAVEAAASVAAGESKLLLNATNSATKTSVQDQISAGVSNLSYVTFDTAKAASTVGCGSFSAVAGTPYYLTAAGDKLGSLAFTPASQSGTYTVPFLAYGSQTYYGTLTVTVTGGGAATPTLAYTTTLSAPLSLKESDFIAWYKAETGYSRLNYIIITGTSDYTGVYKNNGSAFPAANTAVKFYTTGATADTTASYLKNITYQSATPEAVTLRFAAYGGNSASDAFAKAGTAALAVTQAGVPTVTFSVSGTSPAFLYDSEMKNAYKTVTGSEGIFSVKLLSLPAKGTLYENYDGSQTGTALTAASISQNSYAVGQTGAAKTFSGLAYVPAASAASGTDSVTYAAVNADGVTVYTGTITFQYSAQTTGDTLERSCSSDGYAFAGSDFYRSNDSDPMVSLVFAKPSSGWLYREFANGSGVMDEGATYYTDSASNGQYHVSTLTYVPRAGFSGTATITATITTKSGKTIGQVISMKVSGKSASSRFTDVTASNVGSWAADSIDFAYKCGLVNGTDNKSFSPAVAMNRAMLVTVLYRAADSPDVVTTTKFTDLDKTAYYYKAVLWANVMGIVTGTSETTFSPNASVTREQIATILYRYASALGTGSTFFTELKGYDDINDIDAYAVEAMTWAVDRGIITGTAAKTLSPLDKATRAQVAVMLHRYLTY